MIQEKKEIKDYIVIKYKQLFFDQLVKIDLRTYDNIQKIEFGQGDDYTTGCLLSYPYLKEYHKLIAIDLSKQQSFAANRKAMP